MSAAPAPELFDPDDVFVGTPVRRLDAECRREWMPKDLRPMRIDNILDYLDYELDYPTLNYPTLAYQ